jgi:pSer/pThr/pTyr-binding forkhead associated (FHA) protein
MRFEQWITQLVEEPFVRLFAGRMLPQEVAQHLARAMEDGERLSARGTPEVPGRYRIVLNPEDLAALTAHHPNLDEQLATALKALTSRMHVHLRESPAIILQPDPHIPLHAVRIMAANAPAPKMAPSTTEESTRDMEAAPLSLYPQGAAAPVGKSNVEGSSPTAYLIIEDGASRPSHTSPERIFDLTHPVIRIGRALDNDLIVEDRRVSRHHAQLRRRYGRYILQDLGSSGGLKVNGFPVQECVLRPGDVISLAGVNLIYATNTATADTAAITTEEQPGQRPIGNRSDASDTKPMDEADTNGDGRAPSEI